MDKRNISFAIAKRNFLKISTTHLCWCNRESLHERLLTIIDMWERKFDIVQSTPLTYGPPYMNLPTLHIATMNYRCSPGFFNKIIERYLRNVLPTPYTIATFKRECSENAIVSQNNMRWCDTLYKIHLVRPSLNNLLLLFSKRSRSRSFFESIL